MDSYDMRLLQAEIVLEQCIHEHLDSIVRLATSTAIHLEASRLEISQMRNLMNVAVESQSVEVVINYIRYQIGRRGHEWGVSQDGFGHRVIRDLREALPNLVEHILIQVRRQIEDEIDEAWIRRRCSIEVMELYLGYLYRIHVYIRRTGDVEYLRKEVTDGR